jgi:hypothetical protein
MRSFPVWPLWLVFALVLLPGALLLGPLGWAKDGAVERLAVQQDAVGRSAVVTGQLVDEETNAGLPTSSGIYEVTVPESEGGSGRSFEVRGDDTWGFPPPDHPAELSFLIVLDSPPRAAAHGPVGSVEPVTEASVAGAETEVGLTQGVWIGGIVAYWLLVLGLPLGAILLSVSRRRRRRADALPPSGAVAPRFDPPRI